MNTRGPGRAMFAVAGALLTAAGCRSGDASAGPAPEPNLASATEADRPVSDAPSSSEKDSTSTSATEASEAPLAIRASASSTADNALGPVIEPSTEGELAEIETTGQEDEAPSTSAGTPKQASSSPRADGRPSWWLAQPKRSDGRVQITAEALASDVRSARRAAVEAGLRALEKRLGRTSTDMRIEATTVRLLGEHHGAATEHRFAGYVLVSAPMERQGAQAAADSQ